MLFSIVTVTRNNLSGLQKTAHSLRTQSFQDYEWIIIDGASTDGTVAWLATQSAQWVSEPDDGIYDAMNKGLARAQGHYIIFLNAGDSFAHHTILQTIQSEIHNDPAIGFLYGDAYEERPGLPPAMKTARPHTQIDRGLFTHHQAMIYKRQDLGDLRYDTSYKIAADYKFTLQFLQRTPTARYINIPLCLFEAGGVSQQQQKRGRLEQFKIRQECQRVSPLKNIRIYGTQLTATIVRQTAPTLYWRLRQAA